MYSVTFTIFLVYIHISEHDKNEKFISSLTSRPSNQASPGAEINAFKVFIGFDFDWK